jgi:hypothetical protein
MCWNLTTKPPISSAIRLIVSTEETGSCHDDLQAGVFDHYPLNRGWGFRNIRQFFHCKQGRLWTGITFRCRYSVHTCVPIPGAAAGEQADSNRTNTTKLRKMRLFILYSSGVSLSVMNSINRGSA